MTDLTSVLAGFKSLVGYDAAVWTQGSGGSVTWESATNRAPPPETLPTTSEGAVPLESPEGPSLIAAIPGPRRAWLVIGWWFVLQIFAVLPQVAGVRIESGVAVVAHLGGFAAGWLLVRPLLRRPL